MIGEIIVLGGSIYYLAKEKNAAGWLMSIGSLLGILCVAFQTLVFPFIITKKEMDSVTAMDFYYVFYGLNILFSLLFAIGFMMLIIKVVKKRRDGKFS